MPRRCGTTVVHKINVLDYRSTDPKTEKCSIISFRYRMPTPEERQGYINNLKIKENGVLLDNKIATLINYGAKVLAGFAPGDFERKNSKGEWVPVASDKDHPDYYDDWHKLITTTAQDLILILAEQIFESSCLAIPGGGEDIEKKS